MTRTPWLSLLASGGSLTLVALLPYPPVVALARRVAVVAAGQGDAVAPAGSPWAGPTPLGDWDPVAALADLQRPSLGR